MKLTANDKMLAAIFGVKEADRAAFDAAMAADKAAQAALDRKRGLALVRAAQAEWPEGEEDIGVWTAATYYGAPVAVANRRGEIVRFVPGVNGLAVVDPLGFGA